MGESFSACDSAGCCILDLHVTVFLPGGGVLRDDYIWGFNVALFWLTLRWSEARVRGKKLLMEGG